MEIMSYWLVIRHSSYIHVQVHLITCLLFQDSPLRSSSSPPNSTGSTADSDGWTPGPPTSCPQRPPKVPHDRNRKHPQSGGLLSSHTKKDVSQILRDHHLRAFTFSSFDTRIAFCHQHSIPSHHTDERRKADKLKKKRRRKERQLSAGEDPSVPEHQHPISFSGQTIKEEPEDRISIPLHPQCLPSPVPCKEEPSEEQQNWDGQDLEEGVVRVQKVEGFSGNRTVFRRGKQVVFRDEDGSGEDEDIMVDSGTWKLISLCSCSSAPDCPQPDSVSSVPRWWLLGPGDVFLLEALRRPSHDRVQYVSHLDSLVVRQNPQEPCARDVRLPEVPGDPWPPGHPPLPSFARGPQQTHAGLTSGRSSEDFDPFCSELPPPPIKVLHWSLSSARNSCFLVTLVWTSPWPC